MGFDLTAGPVGSETDRNSFREVIRSDVQLQLAPNPQTDKEELDREVTLPRSHYMFDDRGLQCLGLSAVVGILCHCRTLHCGLLGRSM